MENKMIYRFYAYFTHAHILSLSYLGWISFWSSLV
jgi:hypothetical protein